MLMSTLEVFHSSNASLRLIFSAQAGHFELFFLKFQRQCRCAIDCANGVPAIQILSVVDLLI
jgi:hypothetical protein